MAQKIQGYRIYQPREYGTGLNTKELVIAVLLDDKESAFRCPDMYRSEFHIKFRYNVDSQFWWQNSSLEFETSLPDVAKVAAKFYAEFMAYCEKNDFFQVPFTFVEFAATKQINQVWYEGNTGRLFSNPQTKSFSWSYNGQQHYGNMLATNEKMALAKIRCSYPTGYIELTEQPLDLREYDRYQLSWLLAL